MGADFKEPVFVGVGLSDYSGGGFSERSIDLINAYHEFERRLIEHGISTEDSQTVREAVSLDSDLKYVTYSNKAKDTAAAPYMAGIKKNEAPAVNEQITAETVAGKTPYLSQEQAGYLSGKYDVNNLSKEDEKALLDDLEEMGIISKEENTKVYARLAMVPRTGCMAG